MISVLYVDDEPALLEMGKSFLEQSDEFAIDTLASAPAALEILNKKNFDAIVSDYQMPGMNGIEFLKRVRSTDTVIPFIIFTGRGREEVVIEALNNGADFYLQKGGDPDTLYTELMHVIRQSVRMKQTQATLAEQEQRYHDLQNANDLIQSVAPDGHFLFVNKKWLDTLGYQEHDLPNLTIFDVIHEESLKHCMETFHRVISGENVGIIEAVFKTRDGNRVYVEGMATCRMAEGKPQYTRGLFKDVTDRKLAEAALKESEARYRNVVEDQTEFISRFRPDGTHVFVNDAYCRYYNKKREEIIGKRFVTDIPTEDRMLVRQHFASLTQEHPVATITHRIIIPDGRIQWQQWSNRAIFDDEGHVLEYQSVGRDITDLKDAEYELLRKNEEINAAFEELTATEEELRHNYDLISLKEQALRASEEMFRALVEHSLDGILITDFTGNLLFVNRAAGLIVDVADYKAVIGKRNVMEFVAPESQADVLRDFSKVAQGIDAYLVHYKLITDTKREIWVDCIGKKIPFGDSTAMLVSMRDVTERTRAEAVLRESEEKFRSLVEYALEGILILDFQGKILFANNAVARTIEVDGYAGLIGRNVMEFIAPESREDVMRDFIQVTQGHDAYLAYYHGISAKGKKIYVESIGKVITYEGKPADLISIRDITEQKKAENALKESEERYRSLFNSIPDYILVHRNGKILFVNPAITAAMGYDEEELVGSDIIQYIAPESRALITAMMQKRTAGETVPSYEITVLTKGGGRRIAEIHGILILYEGEPASLNVLTDITERKRAEEALRESEEQYRSLAEQVHDGIYIYQGNRFVFVNSLISRLTGYSIDELLSMDFIDLVHPDDRAYVQDITERRQRGEQVPDMYEIRVVQKDGSVRYAELAVSIILFRGRYAVLGTGRDITERKRAEEALRQANKKLSLLSGITRHDINNQLLSLNGFLELLHRKIPDPAFEDYFTHITKASSRITAMIKFTKEYEQIGLHAPVWQDLQTLVNSAGKDTTHGHITLKNDLPANTEVFADPLIVKVFFNLIDNAVRHGEKITTIRFSFKARNGDRIIVCEDDGAGVVTEEKEKIFERGVGKNTGFGLALSREILDITNITIKETGKPGVGARFEIRVPKNMWRIAEAGGKGDCQQ